jgi:raffinose/stachyose/melibiose transport system permease protein
LLPGLAIFLVVLIGPFIANVVVSFTSWTGVGTPKWIGFTNYSLLLHDPVFWASFRNIIAIIFGMALIPTLLGLLLATMLFDFVARVVHPRWASFFRGVFYLPQVLPMAIAGIVWGWILDPTTGALNAFLRLIGLGSLGQDWLGNASLALYTVMGILVWFSLGYPVVTFMAGLQRADPEIYEAAEVDGAGWFARFRHISLNQIRPEIFVVVLTSTIYALKVFTPIYVLTSGGPGDATSVPSYYAYLNFFQNGAVGYGAAISTILSTLVVGFGILFLLAQSWAERRESGLGRARTRGRGVRR